MLASFFKKSGMGIEDIRWICLSSRNLAGQQADFSVGICMSLHIIYYYHYIFLLLHIVLGNGKSGVRCKRKHRRQVIVKCTQNNGVLHSTSSAQFVVYLSDILFCFAYGRINADNIILCQIDNGIKGNLCLARFLVSDDELSLSFTYRINQVNAGNSRMEWPADSRTVHYRHTRFLEMKSLQIAEFQVAHLVHTEHIDNFSY